MYVYSQAQAGRCRNLYSQAQRWHRRVSLVYERKPYRPFLCLPTSSATADRPTATYRRATLANRLIAVGSHAFESIGLLTV